MKYKETNRLNRVLSGAGRLFDFSRSYDFDLYEKYLNTSSGKLDRKSIQSDWQKVGNAIKKAMIKYKEKMC